MKCRSSSEVLAADVGIMRAYEIIAALRAEGYIIVRHDAIKLAQRDARYEALEDVRIGLVRV